MRFNGGRYSIWFWLEGRLTRYLPCACGKAETGFRLCGAHTVRAPFVCLPSPRLSTTVRPRDHKRNPIVIISICPWLLLLVKGELSFIESPIPYLRYGRFHSYHAITDWLKKRLSMTTDALPSPSVYSDKWYVGVSESSHKVVVGVWTWSNQSGFIIQAKSSCEVAHWGQLTLSYVLRIFTRCFQIYVHYVHNV